MNPDTPDVVRVFGPFGSAAVEMVSAGLGGGAVVGARVDAEGAVDAFSLTVCLPKSLSTLD